MTLALQLGKTLGELQETMSASELRLWLAYNKRSPIGEIRADYRAASITSAVINAQGGKLSIEDARLKWGEKDEEEENKPHPLAAFLSGLM